jgi:hypothetical protein
MDMIASAERRTDVLARVPFPWEANPCRIVRLLDMLKFRADEFAILMKNSAKFEITLTLLKSKNEIFKDIESEKVREIGEWLKETKETFEFFGLEAASRQAQKILNEYLARPYTMDELAISIELLQDTINQFLKATQFMFIQPANMKYFSDSPGFGQTVQDRFPEMSGDIEDASRCLGIERSTAAVFHLMCIMEYALRRLGKRLGLVKGQVHLKTWGQILRDIDSAIGSLPQGTPQEKARRDWFSEAAAHVHHVKNSWRDATMHGRRRYTQKEAEAVFEHVKAFVEYLASR